MCIYSWLCVLCVVLYVLRVCDCDTCLAVLEKLCVLLVVCEGKCVICVRFCLRRVPHCVCAVYMVKCGF